ncbi:unnamed protein product [Urochloa humidicola]
MEMTLWTSLPLELLLEIFRRLDITDIVRCAGTCKPWRRIIIGNSTSCLRTRPNRFIPNLLLGFFFHKTYSDAVSLQRTPGPFEPVFMMPTANSATGKDIALYNKPLLCRDGLLLFKGRDVDGLCLYNTMTRDHTFIPAAAFEPHSYVLITGYDDMSPSDNLGFRIPAVKVEDADDHNTFTFHHQQFSCPTSSGTATWGPVKRSHEFVKDDYASMSLCNDVVICGGAVHWLGVWTLIEFSIFGDNVLSVEETQAYTLDINTGRTWATKLPDKYKNGYLSYSRVLATSGDGRLSVVMGCWFHGDEGSCIQLWVLAGEDQWSLEWTVVVPAINLRTHLWMNSIVFCPRSGCLLLEVEGGDLIIEVDTGSSHRMQYCSSRHSHYGYRYPYEMDLCTYLSRMKVF